MKYAMVLFLAIPWYVAATPSLQWKASTGAEGYKVYCGPTPIGEQPAPVAVIDTTHDLAGVVTIGTEYECWVRATTTATVNGKPIPDSAESNHVVFTAPGPVQVITYPTAPSSILLQW